MSRIQLASSIGLVIAFAVLTLVFAQINYGSKTKWERQVADMAANASNVSIRFNHGDKSSIPAGSWEIIQNELQLLTSADIVRGSRESVKSWTSAETAMPSLQNNSVSSIIIEMDGKHLSIDWNQKTANFNRTWVMSTELIRSIEKCLPKPGG